MQASSSVGGQLLVQYLLDQGVRKVVAIGIASSAMFLEESSGECRIQRVQYNGSGRSELLSRASTSNSWPNTLARCSRTRVCSDNRLRR